MLANLLKTNRILTLIEESKSPFSRLTCYLTHYFSTNVYEYDDDPPFSPVPQKPKKPQKKQPDPESNPEKHPLKSELPFDFKYSYSETNPAVEPIGYREPKRFSPFGPGRLDRKWTGTAAVAPKEVDPSPFEEERNRVLGEPLSEEEVAELVERYRHSDCSRQINLGKILLFVYYVFDFWVILCAQVMILEQKFVFFENLYNETYILLYGL